MHISTYTIFPPGYWREIALDYKHTTAEARVSIVYPSFLSRLEDQSSFCTEGSAMKRPVFLMFYARVFRRSRRRDFKDIPGGKPPDSIFPFLFHDG